MSNERADKCSNTRASSSLPLWLVVVLLAFIAGVLVTGRPEGIRFTGQALAQAGMPAGARGILAFTGQLDRDVYGLVMVDVDAGTLWVYQYLASPRRLKLIAARSWVYDRYLEDYNNAEPGPAQVAKLVAGQQQYPQDQPANAPQTDAIQLPPGGQ